MTGIRIAKPLSYETRKAYREAARWCNLHGARIEDKGDRYEVAAIPGPTAAQKRRQTAEARIADLRHHLDSTDWYAARLAETGTPIPEEVRARRQSAREEIDELRAVLAASEDEQV